MTGDFLAGIVLIAIIYMMVRPSSVAAEAVHLFGQAMTALVATVTQS